MSSKKSILVINPNSNKVMTDTLKPILDEFDFPEVTYELFTAPSGPKSINNEDDALESQRHALPAIEAIAASHSAFLVACYSAHPLVPTLRAKYPDKQVHGIFEASVQAALSICDPKVATKPEPLPLWGIVTTGKAWETILPEAVTNYFSGDDKLAKTRFASVRSTGLDADELHDAPKDLVRTRLVEATKNLLEDARLADTGTGGGYLKVVALGCAGMAELESIVRSVVPDHVKLVDGVKAGFVQLVERLQGKNE